MTIDRDPFVRGFWFGLVGGAVKNVLTLVFYYAFRVHLTFVGYSSQLIFKRFAKSPSEIIVALFAELAFGLFLSIVFAYIFSDGKYMLFKGSLYGLFIWFIVRVIVFLFGLAALAYHDPVTALVDIAAAVSFGLTLGLLHQKYSVANEL